jgi:hypothetical protein
VLACQFPARLSTCAFWELPPPHAAKPMHAATATPPHARVVGTHIVSRNISDRKPDCYCSALIDRGAGEGGKPDSTLPSRIRNNIRFWDVGLDSCTASVWPKTRLTAGIVGKKPDDYVFTRPGAKPGLPAEPVRGFRRRWAKVCCAVGIGELVCPVCFPKVEEQAIDAKRPVD